jgi:hypothetical protein
MVKRSLSESRDGTINAVRVVKTTLLMKTTSSKKTPQMRRKQKPLTFGELIASTYTACGKRAARKILQVAINAEIVTLGRRQQHYLVG